MFPKSPAWHESLTEAEEALIVPTFVCRTTMIGVAMNRIEAHTLMSLFSWALLVLPSSSMAASWQYQTPFQIQRAGKDANSQPGSVMLWLPPDSKIIRGLLVGGQLGIELEIALDPEVRKACADNDLGIVYFSPHISGVFHYWEPGNTDKDRWLKAFDDLARTSGHAELGRVPWITMGHSTAGIFCRNVAYWQPGRVAGILHIKSGNFHQKDHLPPNGSLAGIPLVAFNGQFESFGPEGGIRPELGRQTQWMFVRKDIEQFKQKEPNHLMSLWLDLGGDHFHGSPELSQYAALFIRKTAEYRIPAQWPAGADPVQCLPLKLEGGWLTDLNLESPRHAPAAYSDYAGDKLQGMWHYDRELAEANSRHHERLGRHQALTSPACTWLDEGDGWTFKVAAQFLDAMPAQYGGKEADQKVGHANTPIVYRCKINEPVEQVGPDTFRVLRPVKSINVVAVNAGDDQYRATNRWGSISVPAIKGQAQSIDFPPVPTMKADAGALLLDAKAGSGLPVYYQVDYGPVIVKDGKLLISELPTAAQFPIECKVTAYQLGRRTPPVVAPAAPVSQTFSVVKP